MVELNKSEVTNRPGKTCNFSPGKYHDTYDQHRAHQSEFDRAPFVACVHHGKHKESADILQVSNDPYA